MTHNFIILAAGRGSRIGRIGDSLHKSLLPLDDRAIISHQISLAPKDSNFIIVVGYLAEQVIEYVSMAHPNIVVNFIHLSDWAEGGPGYSLRAALTSPALHTTLPSIYTMCDTLWEPSPQLWETMTSWVGTAPLPIGTRPNRWCMFDVDSHGFVEAIYDKVAEEIEGPVWVGLGMVIPEDLEDFKRGLTRVRRENEFQISGAFSTLHQATILYSHSINWLDVGDEAAYRQAIIDRSGYDWVKAGQATYILPEISKVIKFFENPVTIPERLHRHNQLHNIVTQPSAYSATMIAQPYVHGKNLYETTIPAKVVVSWAKTYLWKPVDVNPAIVQIHARKFYYEKTAERIELLRPELRNRAYGLLDRVPWDLLYEQVIPSIFHGDLTYANIIRADTESPYLLKAIDFRERFVTTAWGDRQYDAAKLLSSALVNWDAARSGIFDPVNDALYDEILEALNPLFPPHRHRSIEILAALCLVNSAPLHAAPFDEILLTRGLKKLGELV